MVKKKKKAKRAARRAKSKKVITYRSGLEDTVIFNLLERGVSFQYEVEKIKFLQPEKNRTYNPDLRLLKKDGTFMYIEIKGKLDLDTRQKHEWLKQQYPDMDLRFIFGNWANKIYKGSNISYKQWAEKMGIPSADRLMPIEWQEEIL